MSFTTTCDIRCTIIWTYLLFRNNEAVNQNKKSLCNTSLRYFKIKFLSLVINTIQNNHGQNIIGIIENMLLKLSTTSNSLKKISRTTF